MAGRSSPSSSPPPALPQPLRRLRRTKAGRRCWTRSRPCEAIAHKRLAPGSGDPGVVRQRNRRKLTCRERIDGLLDPGSFREIGSLAGFATFDEAGDVAGIHAGQSRRRPGPHRGPGLHRVRRRLHLARRPCRRRDRPEVALPRPAVDRAAHALDPPARRLVGRRQRRHHGPQAGRLGIGQGKHRRHQGRPAARGRRRRLVPARPSRQHLLHRAARHRAGGQHAAGQRGRHRRGQGGARALLRHGARHLPALRRRSAGRQPRHGLRGHQGGSRRLAHPLPQRLGRQPGRVRRGSHGDDAPLPVATCRRAPTRRRRSRKPPIPQTAARRSC